MKLFKTYDVVTCPCGCVVVMNGPSVDGMATTCDSHKEDKGDSMWVGGINN